MKKFILSLVAVACFAFAGISQDKGEIKFGAGINLWDLDQIGLQGKAVYGISDQLNLGGMFTYFLSDFIDIEFDANVQYTGLDVSDSFKLNPLAGLSYISFGGDDFFGVSLNTTSLHIGASFLFVLESGTTIYVDPILILDSGSGLNLNAGILF